MPRYIVKLTDKQGTHYYLEWSTVVDAPVTKGMTAEEFKEHYLQEYGKQGMHDFAERMGRVELKGTSSQVDEDAKSVVAFNRAGPNETLLSYDEIVRFYCLGEECDEKHPCWKARDKALNKLYKEQGGANYEDFDRIIAEHPYPEKT